MVDFIKSGFGKKSILAYRAAALALMTFASTVNAGDYAADFLRIGVGARPLAMGGAYAAIANDGTAFYWNPAGIVQSQRYSILFDHVPLFGGIAQFNSASIGLSFDKHTAISLGWIRLGIDEIPRYGPLQGTPFDRMTRSEYRSTGQALGYFADTEDAVIFSFARKEFFDLYLGTGFSKIIIPAEIAFGVSGKYIRHLLDDYRGTGQGIDAGLSLRFVSRKSTHDEPDSWLGIGVLARDLSRTTMVWSTQSKHRDEIQASLRSGLAASRQFRSVRTRVTLSVDQEFGLYQELYTGGEIRFFDIVALRGGYANKDFTVGAGLSLMGVSVDYAFIPSELANTHRVSGALYF